MSIDLLATDFDETMTEGRGEVLPAVIEAVRTFTGRGGTLLLASGRAHLSMERIVEAWGIPCFLAAANGSVLSWWPARRRIYALQLDAETVGCALRLGEGRGLPHLLYDDRLYVPADVASERYSELLKVPFFATPDLAGQIGPDIRAVTYRCEESETPRLRADLSRALDGRATVTASHPVLVDVNPRGAEKGEALRRVQRELGVDPDRTLSIGDSPNDSSLLAAASHRACVANAAPELAATATFVSSRPRGCGVLEILERFGIR